MSFVNAGTHFAATVTVGTTNSYVPNWPTEMNSGDPIVIICFPDTASDVVNVPSGYTLRSAGANSIKIFSKNAGSSEAAPTITSLSTVQHECLVLRLPGYDISTFSAVVTGTGSGGSNWSTPAGNPASANNIFFYGGLATGGTSDWAAGDEPTITTLIWQAAGTSMWAGVGYDLLTASGSTGTRTPWENTSGSKVTFAFTVAPSNAVTIGTTPSDIRVTESRTVRITALGTALNTGNVGAYINSKTNAALTPSAVTLVSGNTYDVTFAVTDAYAGLKYDLTGYPVIISTPDGDATSGNIPYLPVTGNDFVNITAGPGDFTVSLGALASGDQIEWETLGGDIDVDDECIITYTGADPDGLTFDVRAWDDTDDTWGDFATQTLTTGGGGGESTGITFNGISASGISSAGLSS